MTTPVRFLDLAEKVTRRMIAPDFDFVPGLTVEARAKAIQGAVFEVVRENESRANDLLKERMVIQGLYDWTRTHLLYNNRLTDLTIDRKIRGRYWQPKDLFLMDKPAAVCAGFAHTFGGMARTLGMGAFEVNGTPRRRFDSSRLPMIATSAAGHKWVIVRMKDGFLQPVDPTNSAASLSKARELRGRIPDPITLPNLPEDWALHFAIYFATVGQDSKLLPASENPLGLSYDQWRDIDIRPLRATCVRRIGSTWFSTAMVDWPVGS